ncbi:MAG: hypothetical protein ACI4VP_02035 [Clostridia bacterium]
MENVQNIRDISKETLTFLAFFDHKMIEKIPGYIITKLCDEAADSKLDFYIDVNKSFEEQKISEKSKDLISLIYYDYIAEEEEKKEILKQWNLNEKNYQNAQKEKYNYDNIFANKKNTTCIELIEVKSETIFQKIKKLLKRIIK